MVEPYPSITADSWVQPTNITAVKKEKEEEEPTCTLSG